MSCALACKAARRRSEGIAAVKETRADGGLARPVVAGLPDVAYAMQREAVAVRPGIALAAGEAPEGQPRAKRQRGKAREQRPDQSAPQVRGTEGEAARPSAPRVRIGVISDSHGYLDPAVPGMFSGVAHIVHAGDIGDPAVLAALREVAPVTAVSGNLEPEELLASLPREAADEVAGVRFVVAHKRKRLFKRLAAGKVPPGLDDVPALVIFGHDHVPSASWVEGTLFLNPGTASAPDSEDDDPTVAVVELGDSGLAVTFIPLERRGT
jgi:putative phosphoesterase